MLSRLKRLLTPPSEPQLARESVPQAPVPAEPDIDIGLVDIHLSGWLQNDTGELVKGFAIGPEDSVLDIGCGAGGYALFSARQGAEMILADVDAEKLETARQRLQAEAARSVQILVTDANPIPLPDGRVSKVVAMEVLEHVDDPAQFMAELVRVAKPGAQFLLTVPDEIIEGVQKHIAPPVYFESPNHIRIFKRGELERLAMDAGLVVESSMQYGFYHSVWWSLYWACENQPLSPPWHPLLENWAETWSTLLSLPAGPQIKAALDAVMPKSQVIVARKP
ncbi:class I SAM-dependent methyltransferase [Pseudomonas sp. UBA2684]|uniref:class I SAM-dependent methyltransferase n=1 Tax=Pseudomonas sp. UBA2684 TaxID=1947311 RepID=UPI000E9076F1|nr:class I SAM-dependent methyltransferase [Pseudomonas sp. UBA2684]HBX55223.1 SAM-dependent methyltransferase [Pseudomonas sp.]|tara:strand:- start:11657 stop:12493 length:837 start_codon:yes stop_codon:yes gene_type:complete